MKKIIYQYIIGFIILGYASLAVTAEQKKLTERIKECDELTAIVNNLKASNEQLTQRVQDQNDKIKKIQEDIKVAK